ncbi:MAG: endolytic transglycosylase MltG, partial [Patescibacteria group bacterium]
QETKVVIKENSGFLEVSRTLKENGIISNSNIFNLYLIASGKFRELKNGTYEFSGEYTPISLANRLIQGPEDIKVLIPEGFTIFEIDKRLSDLNIIEPGALVEAAQKPGLFTEFEFLPQEYLVSLEGFLFPDTYNFSQKTEPKQILAKMLKNFEEKVYSKIDPEMAESPKSLLSLITLASIAEKEVPGLEDRKIVSGILWKRLEKDMLLQVDATVVYAWKIINPDWKPHDHVLTNSDIKIKSLYNTYLYKGLPQGPISNPGWKSIEAALNPVETDYWFYLSTRDGETIFSKTLKEHETAVKKYLK